MIRWPASFGEFARLSIGELMPLDRFSATGRSISDLEPVHVADMQNAGEEFPFGREMAIKLGHRTMLSVPLIREGRALGAILVRRAEVRPFEEKHVTLLKAFANQAAIAIENVRLFEAEQQRTRTHGVVGAADRDQRSIRGDQPLLLRTAARVRHDG